MENAAAMPTAPMPTIDTLLLAFGAASSATCWKSCSLSPDIFGSGEFFFKRENKMKMRKTDGNLYCVTLTKPGKVVGRSKRFS